VLDALDGRDRSGVHTHTLGARAGDRLLICSDGLSDVLTPPELAAELALGTPREAAARLVEAALAAGAHDNVSAVVADVVPALTDTPGWGPVGSGYSVSAPGSVGTSTA
jgi:serine/threonine protein phosphatase PrpC